MKIFIVFLLSLNCAFAQNLKKWQVFELNFESRKSAANPYIEGLPGSGERQLTVEFKGREGEARGKTYNINGFWDGGKKWKVRFAPPYSGVWEYISHSNGNTIQNKKGTIIVTDWSEQQKEDNPIRKGFIYVADTGSRAGRYFIHANGSPLFMDCRYLVELDRQENSFLHFPKIS